jgi:hypothetical protein
MPGTRVKLAVLALALAVTTSADAQSRKKRPREPAQRPPAATPVDKRDSVVALSGSPFNGRPYWAALGHCGGVYFKLSTLYTEIAIRARAVKPDPKINAEYTKKLNDASTVATAHYVAAERFLASERGLDRAEAVMTYDARARDASNRVSTIDAAVAATKGCPALYQACHEAFPKFCTEANMPTS